MSTRGVITSHITRGSFDMIRSRLFLILGLIARVSGRITWVTENKCCPNGQLFDHQLRCTNSQANYSARASSFSCDYGLGKPGAHLWDSEFLNSNKTLSNFCLDRVTNGSLILLCCPMKTGCDGIMTQVKFWGADIAMHLNVTHVVLCLAVVLVYVIFHDFGRRTYNRAVVRHNTCLLSMGCILTVLGVSALCDQDLNDAVVITLWLSLQYFTIATVFWLNVICFDMTLVITQFRWLIGSFDNSAREENRKFRIYGVFAWGGALLPTMVAGVFEACPAEYCISEMKPGYVHYKGSGNAVVNLYFFLVPLITMFFNNILFVYTSYKIFVVQRSTQIVNRTQANTLWRKYFLYLRLYLLMGAPWFFGLLFACLNNLWLLKTCRIVQPVLWLLMLLTHKKMRKKFADKLGFSKSENHSLENPLRRMENET